jgi:deoxyribodipyrimidine photo-lyase
MSATIVWFRRDLRLEDQPALTAALARDLPILPVFIWSPQEEAPWEPGSASRWWLHHSLQALTQELESRGSRLILKGGATQAMLEELIDRFDVSAVYWNRLYEPAVIERDKAIESWVQQRGIEAESFNGSLLIEPWEVSTQQDNPYQVFTPFWKAMSPMIEGGEPLPCPDRLPVPASWPESENLGDLELLPKIPWDAGLEESWTPGTAGARAELDDFLANRLSRYPDDRNRPDFRGSSRLSPYLHFGEISIREVWRKVSERAGDNGVLKNAGECYLRELGWREFAHHLLYHFPETTERPLRRQFEEFPWESNEQALKRWQRGETGYPLVDAGMRELWRTGWMHNRVRMVVASFLCKDLRISWTAGSRWFWDTLVDADLANNTLGWQWTAGCGADAAPYFRIFNPTSQAAKFDPKGDYIRRYCPELQDLDGKELYEPWEAERELDYPPPLVDHKEAREIALAAYETIKEKQ